MRKAISFVQVLVLMLAAEHTIRAVQSTCEYSVQASAAVQASPPQITLSWPQDTCALPKGYVIYRKAPDATSWGRGVSLDPAATFYVDTNVTVGTPYEYQVV